MDDRCLTQARKYSSEPSLLVQPLDNIPTNEHNPRPQARSHSSLSETTALYPGRRGTAWGTLPRPSWHLPARFDRCHFEASYVQRGDGRLLEPKTTKKATDRDGVTGLYGASPVAAARSTTASSVLASRFIPYSWCDVRYTDAGNNGTHSSKVPRAP
ncbi:hypothetical protein NDU88_004037 [Pleurodeles waltl]|uniref:Uncharacterized protein n=1 Tax=Pleurodeles waltl TaxID=8319 RepID=A0AAV7V1T4_PLEWA|nr:hypothetical protein NDU88_004037 [Pleurodeles waltl]